MSAGSRSQAIRAHQRRLQRVIGSVTNAVLIVRDLHRIQGTSSLPDLGIYLNNDRPVYLSANPPIALTISQKIDVTTHGTSRNRSWQTVVMGYSYSLLVPNRSEIVAYQWDPQGAITFPHLHIGPGATGNVTTFGPRGLHRIHFPTKHITVEDVLRLAITEFSVEPRRPDWDAILRDP